ncbi:alpha/beta fold hydrolase [Tamilnaduibacter salinus]|nr:alpha/beta hydrolase [Tamilnaduibacter salinus]
MSAREVRWQLPSLSLAGLSWSPDGPEMDSRPTLFGLHGWLDNAATHRRMAADLARERRFHAIDLAGHGHSGHRPSGAEYRLVDYVGDLAALLDRYYEEPVDLVGHSLGGIVASFYAAAFPERVRRLVLIDSLGPPPAQPEESSRYLREGIERQLRGRSAPKVYPSVAEAIADRAGGFSPLSESAADVLVSRNLEPCAGGYRWCTDPRLRYPSLMRFDEAQILGILSRIQAPVLLVRAESGLLGRLKTMDERRAAIAHLTERVVAGGHHCHLDESPKAVATTITEFLNAEIDH